MLSAGRHHHNKLLYSTSSAIQVASCRLHNGSGHSFWRLSSFKNALDSSFGRGQESSPFCLFHLCASHLITCTVIHPCIFVTPLFFVGQLRQARVDRASPASAAASSNSGECRGDCGVSSPAPAGFCCQGAAKHAKTAQPPPLFAAASSSPSSSKTDMYGDPEEGGVRVRPGCACSCSFCQCVRAAEP